MHLIVRSFGKTFGENPDENTKVRVLIEFKTTNSALNQAELLLQVRLNTLHLLTTEHTEYTEVNPG